jgi:WD repeat and SOF domain-containing protein 1
MDSRYIVTGSEDTNVRIWKSHASDSIGPLLPREKEKLLYNEKLKKKQHEKQRSSNEKQKTAGHQYKDSMQHWRPNEKQRRKQ